MGFRSILAALAAGPHLELLGGLGCVPWATGRDCCNYNSSAQACWLQAGPVAATGD